MALTQQEIKNKFEEFGTPSLAVNTLMNNLEYDVNPPQEELIRQIGKYKELGFVHQVSHLKRRLSNFLWTNVKIDHGLHSPTGYILLDTVNVSRPRELSTLDKLRGRPDKIVETFNKTITLYPPSIYPDEVPEGILDTMLKNKDLFAEYFIGTIEFRKVKDVDPILFGSPIRLPRDPAPYLSNDCLYVYGKSFWLAILGVWGTDWYNVDLHSLQSSTEKETK